MEVNSPGERNSHSAMRFFKLGWAWGVKFVKIRFYKFRHNRVHQKLTERMSRLGTEIYSLYKQGDTEFLKSLVVQQQLKIAEEAESQVFAVYDRIEEIEGEYRRKKEQIAGGHSDEQFD